MVEVSLIYIIISTIAVHETLKFGATKVYSHHKDRQKRLIDADNKHLEGMIVDVVEKMNKRKGDANEESEQGRH